MEGQTADTNAASVVWYDEEEQPLLTFEWDEENGMQITSNVISHDKPMRIENEEAVQLRDFLNEKWPTQVPGDLKAHAGDPAVSEPGRFAPLDEDHPAVGMVCPGCQEPLQAGDKPAMVAIGPGPDPEAREAAKQGHSYTGVAIVAHEECVHG